MASVRQRRGRWWVRWRDLRGRQVERACPTAETARRLRAEIERSIALGVEWEPAGARAVVDLREVCATYLEINRARLRQSTLRYYAACLDTLIRYLDTQHRGPLSASLLTRPMLEDYYAWAGRAGTGRHGRTRTERSAAKLVRVAEQVWRWAEESDRWPGEIPRPRAIQTAPARSAAVVAPSWAEMDGCLLALDPRGWQRRLATLLRYTGLRAGEVLWLEWPAVDLERATITLDPAQIKSGGGRVVPLSPYLVEEMAGWGVREGYVVPSGRSQAGPRAREPRGRDFRRAWARAGVRPAVWAHYGATRAFRRGWKTGMLALGCDRDAVDWLQGHTLGRGSSRASYIDPWQGLPLRETVARVPRVGEIDENVLALSARR